ncbi:MAG: pyrroloquinoline quinone-dependent dehydrogenase [Gemmatimonadales bacterium]
MSPRAAILVIALTLAPLPLFGQAATSWPVYGGDPGDQKFSPLGDITPANVHTLQMAWTYHTGERSDSLHTHSHTSLEATPIVVDGTLYFNTPLGRVIALDPATGGERWTFDPHIDRGVSYGDFTARGVSTWVDATVPATAACHRRIIEATMDGRLIELDARSGGICPSFGSAGVVQLKHGLRRPPLHAAEYEETSPAAVIGNLIVVGSAISDNGRTDMASGEIRAFDARTGALRWTFDPVPQNPKDPAYSTWRGPRAHQTGAANAWTIITVDTARGLVFVPTGSASPDYFGGERLGDNRYANSVVALRAKDGSVAWSFQVVHHDLWDYDNASSPTLATVVRNGRAIPAVLQANKDAQFFVLDRATGGPLFPVEERPVPLSDVPGEMASATQPFSSLPELSPRHFDADSVWGPTDSIRAACRARIAGDRHDGPFTPPSLRESVILPGNIGGAAWGGVAFDSARQIAVVPVNTIAALIRLIPRDSVNWEASRHDDAEYAEMLGTPYVMRREFFISPEKIPCTPPPFGALVALDLSSGRTLWSVPLGDMSGYIHLKTGAVVPGPTGAPNLGGALMTASGLIFIGAAADRQFRAFETTTGRELWKSALPASAKATPMTYRLTEGGPQFVVVAAGGDGDFFGGSDALIAFALPSGGR